MRFETISDFAIERETEIVSFSTIEIIFENVSISPVGSHATVFLALVNIMRVLYFPPLLVRYGTDIVYLDDRVAIRSIVSSTVYAEDSQ